MKKLIFIFLISIAAYGQADFPEGVQISGGQPTTTTDPYITTTGVTGVQGKVPPADIPLDIMPPTIHYTPVTATLKGHYQGIDNALGNIVATTAGNTTRVWFTGDQAAIGAGNFYMSNANSRGTVASAIQSVTNDDNQKKYFTQDLIGQPFTQLTTFPPGVYAGSLSASTSPNSAKQRFTVELYRCDNNGTPIASGVSGAPVGDLGVTVIVILDSGELNLSSGSIMNVPVSNNLTSAFTINAGERVRYHVSAEKVGTDASNIIESVYYGTAYNSYLDVPVPLNSSGITNVSTVTGASVTVALDNLNIGKENISNKSGALTASSTLYPNNNAVISGLALKSDKTNFINIKDLGGVGDGVFDNTTIINNALLTYKEVYFPEGNYLVTSLVNDFGAKITGPGIIIKAVTGGNQQLNTGIDRYNYISGQEYLSFVQKKIMTLASKSTTPIKVSWSGDSTTAGDGTTSGFAPNDLFLSTARKNSISSVTSLNRGHSSANTEDWRTLYLAGDLAENPDLYILRWGINDASRGLSAFKTSLRTGLATIRASKTQAQLSIILMSPNTTSDTPNGRDEKWYEQVRKIYIQAARDYKCAFIDTYSLWLDSRGAADVYLDNPFADGRAIHPLNIFNTWIVSKVFDLVFPESFKTKVSSGYLINESSADRLPSFTDLPETYQKGVTLSRAFTGGWAVEGTASTFFNTDGSGMQLNSSRFTDIPEIYFRTFKGEFATETLSWSNNVRMWHSGNLTNPVTGTGTGSNNFLSKWTGTNAQGSSQIFDDGTSVGINTTSPFGKFGVKVGTDQNINFFSSGGKSTIASLNDSSSTNTPIAINGSSVELNYAGTPKLTVSSAGVSISSMSGVLPLKSYTVATLPAGTQGDTAYVTDATAPTYLGTLTGGGTVKCPVFFNGTIWVSH